MHQVGSTCLLCSTEWNATFWTEGGLEDRAWSVKDGLPEGADAVVDCRGVGAAEELAQVGVTVNPNHGDVLTLSTPLTGPGALDTGGHTVNNGKWLLPTEVKEGRQWWRLGATYSWHRMTPTPNPWLRKSCVTTWPRPWMRTGPRPCAWRNWRRIKQACDLRPRIAVPRWDRGRVKGRNPHVERVGDTRRVGGATAMATHLVNWWLDGVKLPPEVRASRFKSVRQNGSPVSKIEVFLTPRESGRGACR